jgi:hypothetical protein
MIDWIKINKGDNLPIGIRVIIILKNNYWLTAWIRQDEDFWRSDETQKTWPLYKPTHYAKINLPMTQLINNHMTACCHCDNLIDIDRDNYLPVKIKKTGKVECICEHCFKLLFKRQKVLNYKEYKKLFLLSKEIAKNIKEAKECSINIEEITEAYATITGKNIDDVKSDYATLIKQDRKKAELKMREIIKGTLNE